MKADLQGRESSNMISGLGPSMKRADLSLQIQFSQVLSAYGLKQIEVDRKVVPGSPLSVNNFSNWQKCTSLPVTPASNSSPSVSTPISARTHGEQQRSHVSSFCSINHYALSIVSEKFNFIKQLKGGMCRHNINTLIYVNGLSVLNLKRTDYLNL